jgi:hypothetical protein
VLVRGDTEVASWPLEVLGPVDLGVVEELARLQLGARRLGCIVGVCGPSAELSGLMTFLGLARVADDDGRLLLDAGEEP